MIIVHLFLWFATLIVQFNVDLAVHLFNELNCIYYVVLTVDYINNTDI